jgi:hypothetical protein
VGAAKIRPDSRSPRRFPTAMTVMNARPSRTRSPCNCGKAEIKAATPAAMLTATVIT